MILFPFNPIPCSLHCFNSRCFQIYVSRGVYSSTSGLIPPAYSTSTHCPSPLPLISSFFSHTEYRPGRDSSLSLTLSFHWSGHSALPASWIPLRSFFLFSIITDPAWVDPAWVETSLLTTEKVCCLPQKVSPYLISVSSWLFSTMLTR